MIEKFKNNLKKIRKEAGWTAEELGERIGISKQAICNIENGRCSLSKTQYIAIRAVIDYESATNPNKADLSSKVDEILSYSEEEERLLNIPDDYLSKEGLIAKEDIKNKKADENKKNKAAYIALGAGAAAAVLALSFKWMNDLFNDS